MTGGGNYTFNAHHDVDLGVERMGVPMSVGTQTFDAVYRYANGEFDGKETSVIDQTAVGGDLMTVVSQIVCDDNVVYIYMDNNGSVSRVKDEGSFQDLQNSTNIPLDVKDNRMYVPSATALSNAYFNASNDGAMLTIKLSGDEAQTFINDIQQNNIEYEFSDILYVVHLDEDGKLVKINYLFQVYADGPEGMTFVYDYDCTVTITNVGTTVVNAPDGADEYPLGNFIE